MQNNTNTINIADIVNKNIDLHTIDENIKFKLENISLLENLSEKNSIIDDKYVVVKLICDNKIKYFLKHIEKKINKNLIKNKINSSININIDYDLIKCKDYYQFYFENIKEHLKSLINSFNIKKNYDICLSYKIEMVLDKNNYAKYKLIWILHNIEINNDSIIINEDEDNEFDIDFEDIKDILIKNIDIKLRNKINIVNELNNEIDNIKKIKYELQNNFEANYESIDKYDNIINQL